MAVFFPTPCRQFFLSPGLASTWLQPWERVLSGEHDFLLESLSTSAKDRSAP